MAAAIKRSGNAMKESDKQNFSTLLDAVASYYRQDTSPTIKTLYWNGLKDLDFAAIQECFNRHMQNPDTGQFMPKIADVRKMLSGTSSDSALMAWSKVDRAIRQVGTYETVCFDDPIINKVIADMGGWMPLGLKTEDEWPFVANEFQKRYRADSVRGGVNHYPARLIGRFEAENSMNGYKRDGEPLLIGDQKVAQLVFNSGSKAYRPGETLQIGQASPLRVIEGSKSA